MNILPESIPVKINISADVYEVTREIGRGDIQHDELLKEIGVANYTPKVAPKEKTELLCFAKDDAREMGGLSGLYVIFLHLEEFIRYNLIYTLCREKRSHHLLSSI